jgi:hemolysin activation/secretion protein
MKKLILLSLTCFTAFAEESYPIAKLGFKYTQSHPEQIALADLGDIEVTLALTPQGYVAVQEAPQGKLVKVTLAALNQAGLSRYSKLALSTILEAAHNFFESHRMAWAYITLKQSPKEETVAEISIPTVAKVSTRASEHSYMQNSSYLDKQKERIEANFPLKIADPSTGYPGAYVDPDALNNYLYTLNRHPGKRVDLEVGPVKTPDGVTLDFVITEERPWHLYLTATNNIPKVIDRWQESAGFMHTQLTGRDDILKLDYTTDSFDSYYTANASYEAPWGLSHGKRWSVSGTYNRFTSAEFGLGSHFFRGTQAIADFEFNGVLYQRKKLFLEGFGIMEYRHIHNREHFIYPAVMKNFLFPSVGLKCLELKSKSKVIASVQVETTISNWFWDVKRRLDALGRRDLSPSWALLKGTVYWSFYIEPWISASIERMANEFVFQSQIQYAFNFRLIPQLEGILGGVSTVRGYPQSDVSGDNLYLGSLEYRLHIPQLLKPSPESKTKFLGKEFRYAPPEARGRADWDLVLRGFFDVGKTTNNRPVRGEKNAVVEGVGLGADFVLWSNLVLKYDWGIALKSAHGTHKGETRSYFSAVMMY